MFRKPKKRLGRRGFKIDAQATGDRSFADGRSFVSVDAHEILYGIDKTNRRREIYDDSHGRCQLQISPQCRGHVSFTSMEWDHINEGAHRNRCDCRKNGRAVCYPCHRMRHVYPRWTPKQAAAERKAEAHEEFAKLIDNAV